MFFNLSLVKYFLWKRVFVDYTFQFSLKNRFSLGSWTDPETLDFFDDKDRILILALLMLNILKIKNWFNFLVIPQ